MHVGIWHEHFAEADFEETCDALSSIGYEALAITPREIAGGGIDVPEAEVDRINSIVAERGMDISGIARVFHRDHDHSITSPDPAKRERAREYILELIDLCGAFDGTTLTFGSGTQRRVPEDVEYERAWEHAIDVIGHDDVLAKLASEDVTLTMEPLSESSTNFLNTTPETVAFVNDIGSPHVGMTIDGYHLVNEDEPIPDLIYECQDHLVEFQADDPAGMGPGSGDVDYGPILSALDDVGFDGYITVEFHAYLGGYPPDDDPLDVAGDSLRYLERSA